MRVSGVIFDIALVALKRTITNIFAILLQQNKFVTGRKFLVKFAGIGTLQPAKQTQIIVTI